MVELLITHFNLKMTANISFRTKSLLEKWRTYLSNI